MYWNLFVSYISHLFVLSWKISKIDWLFTLERKKIEIFVLLNLILFEKETTIHCGSGNVMDTNFGEEHNVSCFFFVEP